MAPWIRVLATGAAAPVLVATVLLRQAPAHDRSTSHSSWRPAEGGFEVTLAIDAREWTRIGDLPATEPQRASRIAHLVPSALTAARGGRVCEAVEAARSFAVSPGRSAHRWRVRCDGGEPLTVTSRLAQLLGVDHLHFARIAAGEAPDAAVVEVLLHRSEPTWVQGRDRSRKAVDAVADAFTLGLRHVAGGPDHLLFLFGLILLAWRLGEVAMLVTAFTAAHAVTLALAATGALRAPAAPVEALIAASIAVLAVENATLAGARGDRSGNHPDRALLHPSTRAAAIVFALPVAAAAFDRGRVPLAAIGGLALFSLCYCQLAAARGERRRLRWLVALVFGLLHGLGFAGSLLETGFSRARIVPVLFGFHCGVEAAQLAFVAAVWPTALLLRRWLPGGFEAAVVAPASAALLAAATAWYALRTFS